VISPKWAVLVAAFALVGAITTVPTTALAQDDESQNAEVNIERNNEIEQSIEQSQEACTNEAEVSVSDDDVISIGGENEVEVEQSNECDVRQDQDATNAAAIVDASENVFDIITNVVSDDDNGGGELFACDPDSNIQCRLDAQALRAIAHNICVFVQGPDSETCQDLEGP
jgi:hypothetical protein